MCVCITTYTPSPTSPAVLKSRLQTVLWLQHVEMGGARN